MRTFAKPTLEKDYDGETVSNNYNEGNCSKADTPNNIPLVEVHCESFCELMSVILRERESKNDLAFFVRWFCGENLWIHVTSEINKINAISKFSLKASSIRCALLKTCHINPLEYHKLYVAKVITTKKCIILFTYVSLKHHRSTKQFMEKNNHLERNLKSSHQSSSQSINKKGRRRNQTENRHTTRSSYFLPVVVTLPRNFFIAIEKKKWRENYVDYVSK